MKRKIAIILVAVALVISLLPVSAIAEGSYIEGGFYYELGDGCIVITGYFGKDEAVVVPDNIAGYPVSVIAEGAFVGTNAKKVYLPATIMEIETGAIAEGIEVFRRSGTDNTEPQGNDNTDSYQPLVQPERDENGNVAEGVNEGTKKIYVDKDGNLIENPEEIKAIDAAQEAAGREEQLKAKTDSAPESAGINGWLIAGISFAVMAIAGILFFVIRRTKIK